jgi:hypothetical protein
LRIKIHRFLKHAGWSLTDSRSVRFGRPPDCYSEADWVLFVRKRCAAGDLQVKGSSVNLTTPESWSFFSNSQLGCVDRRSK